MTTIMTEIPRQPKYKRVWAAGGHSLSASGGPGRLFGDFDSAVEHAREANEKGWDVVSVETVWRTEEFLREHYPELL